MTLSRKNILIICGGIILGSFASSFSEFIRYTITFCVGYALGIVVIEDRGDYNESHQQEAINDKN